MCLIVSGKAALLSPHDFAGFQRRPQIAVAVFEQIIKTVAGMPGELLLLKTLKRTPSNLTNPSRSYSQISIARLHDVAHGVLWQPVVCRPMVKAILCRDRNCRT